MKESSNSAESPSKKNISTSEIENGKSQGNKSQRSPKVENDIEKPKIELSQLDEKVEGESKMAATERIMVGSHQPDYESEKNESVK